MIKIATVDNITFRGAIFDAMEDTGGQCSYAVTYEATGDEIEGMEYASTFAEALFILAVAFELGGEMPDTLLGVAFDNAVTAIIKGGN